MVGEGSENLNVVACQRRMNVIENFDYMFAYQRDNEGSRPWRHVREKITSSPLSLIAITAAGLQRACEEQGFVTIWNGQKVRIKM